MSVVKCFVYAKLFRDLFSNEVVDIPSTIPYHTIPYCEQDEATLLRDALSVHNNGNTQGTCSPLVANKALMQRAPVMPGGQVVLGFQSSC